MRTPIAVLGLLALPTLCLAGTPGLSPSGREAVDLARTKIVVVKSLRGRGVGSATGFLVGPGRVVTARHTVLNKDRLGLWVNGVPYPCRLEAVHPRWDVALLSVTGASLHLKPLTLARRSDDLLPNEELVILAGFAPQPGSRSDPVRRNPIRAAFLRRERVAMGAAEMGDSLAMRATVEQGDSGSPVLRSRTGEVVGLLISREAPDPSGFSYQAYALPVELFREWLARPDPAGDDFYLLRAAGRAGAP